MGQAMYGPEVRSVARQTELRPRPARAWLPALALVGVCFFAVAQEPPPEPDMETTYLGYAPDWSGSSIQCDLDLEEMLLRLTCRIFLPQEEFEDFHIDLGTVTPQTWHHMQISASDRVVFSYVDPDRNMQVKGDFLLDPYWRGVLDISPIDGSVPIDTMPFAAGSIRWLLVRAPLMSDTTDSPLMRPMPYGVFETVAPLVSIPIGVVTSSQGRIFLDDGWDDTADVTEVTAFFSPAGTEAQADSIPFRYGTNRLRFVFPQGQFQAFCLNYDEETLGLAEEPAGDELSDYFLAQDQGETAPTLMNGIGLFVDEDQEEVITSEFLRVFRFRPIGFARAFFYYQLHVHGEDLSDNENGSDRTDLFEYVTGAPSLDSRQAHLFPEIAFEPHFNAETIPTSNANNNANRGYSQTNHAWNHPNNTSGRALLNEHFWMDSFAGHRLITSFNAGLATNAPANVMTVAVVDSGFGQGNAFPNNDFPLAAFGDLWVLAQNNQARPQRINADAAGARVPVAAGHLADQRISDRSVNGHGTPVAHLVAGRGGMHKLGTGPNSLVTIALVPGLAQQAAAPGYFLAVLSQLIDDPGLRVMNFSNGGPSPAGVSQVMRRTSEHVFDTLSREGIASVLSAGNHNEAPGRIYPSLVVPARGMRDAATSTFNLRTLANEDRMSPLAMRVSAFSVPIAANGTAQEALWNPAGNSGSGVGNNISVAAAGNNQTVVNRLGNAAALGPGTSFAAPLVSGLVAEVLRILDQRAGVGTPATKAARAGRAGRVLQAIEIVEATADRLGRNIGTNFDQAEPADNDAQGFGRINVWKAILSAVNGGVAAGGTVRTGAAGPNRFAALTNISAANTQRYGFLIRLQSTAVPVADRFSNATAWINSNPYDDAFNPAAGLAGQVRDTGANTEFTGADGGAAVNNVVAYKRLVSLNSRLPVGFVTAGGGATGTGVQEMVFGTTRAEITGAAVRRLELRRNADAATVQPFFSILLDINRLRNNGAAPNNGENIRFDDFVFEILVDHFVTFNVNEAAVGAGAGLLPAANEVALTVTVQDSTGTGVGAVPVTFTVVDAAGAQSGATQIRLRAARGMNPAAETLNVNSSNVAATRGQATVFVTRIAAGGGGAAPQGVVSRIRVQVPINAAGGAAAGTQFPQDFTVPTR